MSTEKSQPAGDGSYAGVSPQGLRRVYAALYGLAMVDGTFEARELQVLEKYRNDFQIDADEAQRIEDDVDRGVAVRLSGEGPELDTARRAMFDLATVDDVLTAEEEALLANITQASGYTLADLQSALVRRGLTLSPGMLEEAGLCDECGQEPPEEGEEPPAESDG